MSGKSQCSRRHLPVPPLQERLFLESLRKPGSYIAREVYELPADVDVDRFQEAWDTVVKINPIWRTRLVQLEEMGMFQVVVAYASPWLSVPSAEDYMAKRSHMNMGLGTPLFEVLLSRSPGSTRCSFAMTARHALYDGRSLSDNFDQVHKMYTQAQCNPNLHFNVFIRQLIGCGQERLNLTGIPIYLDLSLQGFPMAVRVPHPLTRTLKSPLLSIGHGRLDPISPHQRSSGAHRRCSSARTQAPTTSSWA